MAGKTVAVPDEVLSPTEFINKLTPGLERGFVPRTWDDLINANDGEIIEFEGSPWEVVAKNELVDVPFMIADVRHNPEGSFGAFVSIMLLTEFPLPNHNDNRYVINDGSTGIYDQVVQMVQHSGRKSGIKCDGLRASSYEYTLKDFDGAPIGKPIPATTYYIK